MGVTTYFPKGSSYSATQGVTLIYPAVTAKMILIIGHGIGERNAGDLAGCQKSSGWGGWANIKLKADVYGMILIFINTPNNYENSEYQNAVIWARARYPTLINMIWVWGHSLGSYGLGRYAFADATFTSRIAGWIQTGSGNFLSFITSQWTNIYNNNVKVWAITANNDTVSGTSPVVATTTYSALKALSSNVKVIRSVFPSTEWPNDFPVDAPTGSKTAHNQVLNRFSTTPIYYSKGNVYLITAGITASATVKMNIYQWMLSNPKTSIYQDPTETYVGPKYNNPTVPPPPPPAETKYYKTFIFTADGVFGVTWTDNTTTTYAIPSGYVIDQLYTLFDGSQRQFLVIKMLSGATLLTKTFGPVKP